MNHKLSTLQLLALAQILPILTRRSDLTVTIIPDPADRDGGACIVRMAINSNNSDYGVDILIDGISIGSRYLNIDSRLEMAQYREAEELVADAMKEISRNLVSL